ncbi:MAG TPA: hypothetical protein VGE01_15285 [Fimbriimonas sp.]
MHLEYLTVQDVLWINFQVTKSVHRFNYARLEEATYYQYAYGESNSLIPQAGRLLSGFLKLSPMEAGNEPTAFVAVLAFLVLNGRRLDLSDDQALDWFSGIREGRTKATEAISAVAKEAGHDHHHVRADVRKATVSILNGYPKTIAALANANSLAASSASATIAQ